MKVLSAQELHRVQGAFGPVGAAIGGVAGGLGYIISQQVSGSTFSPTTLATSVGAGAIAGGLAGPNGVVWGFNGTLAKGMVEGVAQKYGK
ncbi:hypothetical protein [Neisseria sp.]|uniref:hypothetical protein n=1 Tax=Neisseria sp. TaxID=192066 RepID=UPI0026DABF73|nr:hypothetical protein [Neisseria sp.]MDO4907913.1 hypothetical protein [Neisseria sp.]